MAIKLRQSTAAQEIPLGYFVDSGDGDVEETGLTIANTDIKLWKMGATSLANKNSGGATHMSNGIYYAVLDATDTNTLGALVAFIHVAGALTVRVECEVLSANVYDSLIAGTDTLDVALDFTVVLPASPITDTVGAALKGQTWPVFTVSSPIDNGDGTMDIDTDLTLTNDISATTPKPIIYFPTEDEDERQSASCNVPGEHAEVVSYNTTTKVLTIKDCSALPVATSKFRFY